MRARRPGEKLGVETTDYIGAFLGAETEESDYPGLNPLPEEATLLEMSTNSKSGAFFFFTPVRDDASSYNAFPFLCWLGAI